MLPSDPRSNADSLTDAQVEHIVADLRYRGLLYAPLLDDLVDHVCCLTEARLDEAEPFEDAYAAALAGFGGTRGLHRIQRRTRSAASPHVTLLRTMAYASTAVAAALFAVLSFNASAQEPSVLPFAKEHLVRVSAEFGQAAKAWRGTQRLHRGVDFVVPEGTPIYATGPGVVEVRDDPHGYGLNIVLTHSNVYTSRYSHLSRFAVEDGQTVTQGDLIGYAGNTGRSTGPHLHYEVLRNGEPVDPSAYYELD
ncbi:MAG: M23 family metallopeptidase [Bacteroidota bacterium]